MERQNTPPRKTLRELLYQREREKTKNPKTLPPPKKNSLENASRIQTYIIQPPFTHIIIIGKQKTGRKEKKEKRKQAKQNSSKPAPSPKRLSSLLALSPQSARAALLARQIKKAWNSAFYQDNWARTGSFFFLFFGTRWTCTFSRDGGAFTSPPF